MVSKKRKINYFEILRKLLILMFFIVIFTSIFLTISGKLSVAEIITFLEKEQRSTIYWVVLLYLVSPSLILPTFYLPILVGALWGPFWGILIDVAGATAGSSLSFFIARQGGQEFVTKKFQEGKWRNLLDLSGKVGWRLNVFMRITPVFPASAIGYFFGITKIKSRDFVLSTAGSAMLTSIVFVPMGDAISEYLQLNKRNYIPFLLLILYFLISFYLLNHTKIIDKNNKVTEVE